MELTADIIKKYSKRSIPWLKKKAGDVFRAWIRKRDKGRPCISCGSFNTSDAGHYYSAGHHSCVEFNENNVHLQCRRCNTFLSGNLIEYRKGLLKKIGAEELEKLDNEVAYYKRHGYKQDRFYLISIIEEYTQKLKQPIYSLVDEF